LALKPRRKRAAREASARREQEQGVDIPPKASDLSSVEETERPARMIAAYGWMGVALASFVLVAIAGREAGKTIPTLPLVFYRSVISLAILLIAMRVLGQAWSSVRTRRLGLHTLRCGVHFCGQAGWLHALMLIPLAQLFALEFTAPLWVALLAPALLGERLTPVRIAAAAIGFSGALIVARPDAAGLGFGTALALGSAFCFGLSIVLTKRLTSTETTYTILFYMMLIQALISLAFSLPSLELPSVYAGAWVVVLGLAGLSAHFGLTRACSLADAIVVAPMDFLRLPLIVVVGIVLYNEPLVWWVIVGGCIVVLANALNLWGERRLAAAQAASGAAPE
jgi:drug/metabolite transporter (DMT)-like permease